MFVVFSASHVDFERTRDFMLWLSELRADYQHWPALLVSSASISEAQSVELMRLLKHKCRFHAVFGIRLRHEDPRGWPVAPNEMFRQAATWIRDTGKQPFLWLESDAIPLTNDWLPRIQREYERVGKKVMGAMFDKPWPHLNGVAVYPQHFQKYNPFVFNKEFFGIPFDTVKPELTIKVSHVCSPLITRSLVVDAPHTFPDQPSIKSIVPSGCVLFHGCKDGSLISRLREQRQTTTSASPVRRWSVRGLFSRNGHSKVVTVRRTGALGDSLAATAVAHALRSLGHKPVFQCNSQVQRLLLNCPKLSVTDTSTPCDVNLDGVYENDPLRRDKHFNQMFFESANAQLKSKGITISPLNAKPMISCKPGFIRRFTKRWEHMPRPWIAVSPRSNSFLTRTVPDETWSMAAAGIPATCFWLGNHGPAPKGIVDLKCREIQEVVNAIAACDVFVGVDSGPLHIAAALNKPSVAILQSSSPELHLSDLCDFEVIQPHNLTCLNCQQGVCPLNANQPPCQMMKHFDISAAVNRKIGVYDPKSVSAIVVVYSSPKDRLNKCIEALLPQVSEVIVDWDPAGKPPQDLIQHPKVRCIQCPRPNIGFGRKANHAFRHTSSAWVLNINDDVFLDPGAVEEMLKTGMSREDVGVVGCLLWYPGRQSIQHGGAGRKPGDIGLGHIDHRASSPSITKPTEMEGVTGACSLIRRETFYDVGGFDERYYLYWEDTDFCMRAREGGWKVMYTPLASGIHDEHSTTKVHNDRSRVGESQKLFHATWSDYFIRNANRKLGVFK